MKRKIRVLAGSLIGAIIMLAGSSAPAWALVGPHSYTNTTTGDVFLGGDYIELGISKPGSFGTTADQPLPTGFYGTAGRTNIGMSTNPTGFGVAPDLRMDYFLPGSPEERWVVGYKEGGTASTGSNSLLMGTDDISDNVVTNQSSGDTLQAQSQGTFNGKLQVTQVISFNSGDKFFKNDVTLKNVSGSVLDSVRYMRSFDPDNTVDQGGDYTTHETIPYQQPADGKAVVIADTNIGEDDPVYDINGSYSPILFYSSDSRARVSTYGFSNTNPYDPSAYDDALPKGTDMVEDQAITIAFDVGTLNPGDSQTVSYYTSLDNRDFSDVLQDISTEETSQNTTVPNNGDANNDGVQDSTQANIAGEVNPLTNNYVLVQAGADCTVHDQSMSAASGLAAQDGSYSYPAGLMNFTLQDCGTAGYTTTVTQYYYGLPAGSYVLRKYNATAKTYTTITNATITHETIAGQDVTKVSYPITDGGALDEDGTANGTIVDPAGLALASTQVPDTGYGMASRPSNFWGVVLGISAAVSLTFGTHLLYRTKRATLD